MPHFPRFARRSLSSSVIHEEIMKEIFDVIVLLKQYPMAARVVVWVCFIVSIGVLLFVPRTSAPKNAPNLIRSVSKDPHTDKTQIHPRTKALVDQRVKHLISQKIDPWLMFHTDRMKLVSLHSGQNCQYKDVRYEGTPEFVFWDSLIDPFLEDEIRSILDSVGKECVENKVEAKIPLEEAAILLHGMVERVYDRMAHVDQRLRTKPTQKEKAPRKDVQPKVDKMTKYVDEQVIAAKTLFSRQAK